MLKGQINFLWEFEGKYKFSLINFCYILVFQKRKTLDTLNFHKMFVLSFSIPTWYNFYNILTISELFIKKLNYFFECR